MNYCSTNHTPFDDKKWLSLAIKEAEKAQQLNEVPIGAVIVDQSNNLLASSHNQPISTHNPTSHAEIEVITRAGQKIKNYRLKNTCLYTTLEPCLMCTGAIIHARISRVVFAAKDPKAGACGSLFSLHNNNQLNHQFEVVFLEDQSYITQLKLFFHQKRQKNR